MGKGFRTCYIILCQKWELWENGVFFLPFVNLAGKLFCSCIFANPKEQQI
jgi:hypothetical protein